MPARRAEQQESDMLTLQALRERRAQIVADMESILDAAAAENRDFDEDEAELWQSYEKDLASVKTQIERRESLDGERQALNAVGPAHTPGQASTRPIAGPEAKREFENLGEFIGAVVGHYRDRRDDPRLSWHDNAEIGAQDGQRMDEGSAGGFLVPTQFRDTILRVDPQEAIVESRSNVMEAGSPPDAAITMPALDQTGTDPANVYGGVEVSWIGEGATKPQTEAKLREVELRPHELAAHIPLTDKLMRNAPAMTSQVEMLMRQALTGAKERSYLLGAGIAQPLGMINAEATYSVNRATANTAVYADLSAMVARLLMSGGGSPYWLINQSAYTQLTQLQNPEGQYVWQPNAIVGSPGSLFGYPVFWHQRSPQLGSKGDFMLVNTSPYYMIKPGSGPFVAMGYAGDDFIQNRTRIKTFLNVDAQPWLTEPFTQEGGYQVSPFVALDVPA